MKRQWVGFGTGILGLVALVGAPPMAAAPQDAPATAPVVVSPVDEGRRVEARHGVVSSASGLASEAGVEMLRAGGNAVDAAVAAAFALGVVEPQMSGLGGSGAALVWMETEGRAAYLDFYAAQPAESWRDRLDTSRPGDASRATGDLRAAAIPGAVAGLLALHERFGLLPRARVLAPAVHLAEDGFPVGRVLADFIASGEAKMKPFPRASWLFFPRGTPLGPGETLRNPDLAESLKRIALEGRRGFDRGPTAEAVIATLNAGGHPATLADLAAFEPQWKRPLCTDYRGLTVLSAPPPQTGFQVLHTLELLEPFDLKALGLPTRAPEAFDVLASALRVGHAQARANGDPNWVAVPAHGMASSSFADTRRTLVGRRSAVESVAPADAAAFDRTPPAGECGLYDPYGPAPAVPSQGDASLDGVPAGEPPAADAGETSHVSVVDREGNAVSLTVTNSSVWGSGGFAAGFFLNDSGFRFTAESLAAPASSRWRIRASTIAPTLVLRGGDVQMVVGAPGGGRIPSEIVQVMVYVLDHGLDPLDAVRLPRLFGSAANRRLQIEHGFRPEVLREVRAMGYEPAAESAGYARIYLVVRRGDVWVGVADPRHDGEPRGY